MLTLSAKQIYYKAAGHLMLLNGWLYKRFRRARAIKNAPVKLHLVPGPNTYLQACINIDANMFTAKCGSIGGRVVNFIFCWNEHLIILTQSFLTELATRARFDRVEKHLPIAGTDHAQLFAECMAREHERTLESPHTVLVEMHKSP